MQKRLRIVLLTIAFIFGCTLFTGFTHTVEAASNTTTSVKTKTSKKKVTMSTPASKTYSKTKPATSKTSRSTKSSVNGNTKKTVATVTTVKTQVTNKYTKKSKVKTVVTKVKTTVKKTTTTTAATSSDVVVTGTTTLSGYMGKVDSRVASAFQQLGFTVKIDASAKTTGSYNCKTRTITLRTLDTVLYHEMGHFLSFVAGGADSTSEFKSIYAAEKSKFTGVNKAYVTSTAAEYFAESFRDYTTNPSALKASRPQTYNYIVSSLGKVTSEKISSVNNLYANVLGIWK